MAAAEKPILSQALTPLIYIVVVILWETGARVFHVPSWILPTPSLIASTAVDWAPELAFHSFVTLRETLIGFLVALIFSVPLAIAIAFTSLLRRILYPILLGLQSVPKVALAPLVILWLGIGNWPKIVIVTLVCFFPILVNLVAGFEATPKAMLDLMHSLRASHWAIFRRLRIPIATPYLFTGCKIAITFAVIGAVIGNAFDAFGESVGPAGPGCNNGSIFPSRKAANASRSIISGVASGRLARFFPGT